MTAAVINRLSWPRVLVSRALMVVLLVAWTTFDMPGAGSVFEVLLWVGIVVSVLAALLPVTKPSAVRSGAQVAVMNFYRASVILLLAWHGHPGLALAFLAGVLAAEVHYQKFDESGMPILSKDGVV